MTRSCRGLVPVIVALVVCADTVAAQSLRDPEDGAFDVSAFLATSHGFLPVATPITDPAVGFGGALALAFFHRPEGWDLDEARAKFDARERMTTPSATAVFGMYTSDESWGAGGGHLGIWGGGRWRYTGGGGFVHLNLSIAGEAPSGGEVAFEYELEGWGAVQSLRYKLGSTDFYVGALYNFLSMTTQFTGEILPGVEPGETDSALGSAGLSLGYDSRNSTFTPDRGLFTNVEMRRQDTALGGDFDYWSSKASIFMYMDPIDALVIGLRAEASAAGEDAPFWAQPGVRLRGLASGRYKGDRAGVFEAEARWDVSRRWSVVGFGGTGWTMDVGDEGDANSTRWLGSGGTGVRYLLARAFGLRGGTDIAYGQDGWALYITMGSAWGGF